MELVMAVVFGAMKEKIFSNVLGWMCHGEEKMVQGGGRRKIN